MKFQFMVLYQCQIEHFFKGVRGRLAGVGGSSAQSSCTKEYKSFGLRAPIYLYSRLGLSYSGRPKKWYYGFLMELKRGLRP